VNIGPEAVALLSGVIFAVGIFGLLSRRDALGMLASLAVLLVASVVAFAGFTATGGGTHGGVAALAVIVLCAVQVLVGAAVMALLHRRYESVDVDRYDDLQQGVD
jgi:NADH-quinone oxidoreductase subunit K